MEIQIETMSESPQVTTLHLKGDLDASTFKELIGVGRKIHAQGTHHLLLDLSGVDFMSSSGLVALHSIALIMRGEAPPDLEQGWNTIHSMGDYVEKAETLDQHVKLLNPTVRVTSVLEKTGFTHIFEVFNDKATALASFRQNPGSNS